MLTIYIILVAHIFLLMVPQQDDCISKVTTRVSVPTCHMNSIYRMVSYAKISIIVIIGIFPTFMKSRCFGLVASKTVRYLRPIILLCQVVLMLSAHFLLSLIAPTHYYSPLGICPCHVSIRVCNFLDIPPTFVVPLICRSLSLSYTPVTPEARCHYGFWLKPPSPQ